MIVGRGISLKVVFLGDTSVGKSCLAVRFIKNEFFEFQEPTIGAAFLGKTINVNDKRYKFEIWDTAGQERYRSLAPMYYRGAKAALVVYDVSMPETFNRAKTWVQELQKNVNNIFIILVGNKCDLNNIVKQEDVDEYIQNKDITHYLCSAKADINIANIFYTIANNLPKGDNTDNIIKLSKLSSSNEDNKNVGICC